MNLRSIEIFLSILAIVIAIGIPLWQINIQFQREYNDLIDGHMEEMKTLRIEIERNIYLIDTFPTAEIYESNEAKRVSAILLTENLRKAVTNGNIRHKTFKENLFDTYFEIVEINNELRFINNPITPSSDVKSIILQINNSFVDLRNDLVITKENLDYHINCLQIKRDFSQC